MTHIAHALLASGETPAAVVGVSASAGTAFLETLIAAQADGAVVAALRPGDDPAGFDRVLEPAPRFGWLAPRDVARADNAPAQLVRSSGTTAAAKTIVLTHANISTTSDRLVGAMAMDASVREYVGVPPGYSFGLGRVRAVARAGGEVYLPARGFDPSEIAALLAEGSINAISAVPTLWRVLLANAELIGRHGRRVRWIEIGSQAMTGAEKIALCELFPEARIVQHYGLTEASRTTFLRVDGASATALASVGRSEAPIEVALDPEGRIRIRGPNVAPFLIAGGGLRPLTDAEGWLTTDDIGRIDGEGWLHFLGRADDQINCGGIKLYPDTLESAIAAALPAALRPAEHIAVAGTPDPLRGEGVLVAYEAASGLLQSSVRAAAESAVERHGLHTGAALHVVAVEELPRTDTGKVRRRALSEAFVAPAAQAADTAAAPLEARILAVWRAVLGDERITLDDNFIEASGDPELGAQLVEAMCAAGLTTGAAAALWDGLSVAEIVALGDLPAGPGEGALADATARLLALWHEALGRTDIDTSHSYYDIGGDSLSAIGLALSMERAGFEPDVARAIFDGRTIAEIAAMSVASAPGASEDPATPAPPRARAQIALLSDGLNLVKALVIVCIVASHWLPPVLHWLNLEGSPFHRAVQPLLTLGSPTLAFAFGIGIAAFQTRQYSSSRRAFRDSTRSAVLLLSIGLAVSFGSELAGRLVGGVPLTPGMLLDSLAGTPFIFFLGAAASLPLWIGRLRRDWTGVQATLAAALGFYAVFLLLRWLLPAQYPDEASQALRRIVVGHWGLFQMTGLMLFGVAAGQVIELQLHAKARLAQLAPYGLLLAATGIVLSAAAGQFETWFVHHGSITTWGAITYAGIALYMIGSYERLAAWAGERPWTATALQLALSVGILLFPLFVLQSMVYHLATILNNLTGLAFIRSLALWMALWLVSAAYMTMRVRRLYFGRTRPAVVAAPA